MKQIFTLLFIIVAYGTLQSQTLFETFDSNPSSKYSISKHGGTDSCYTNHFLDNDIFSEGTGALRIQYNVEAFQDWGGGTLMQLKPQNKGSLWYLAKYDTLSIDFYNKTASTYKGRATLVILLYDASSLTNKTQGLAKQEWWYSYHKVLDLDSGWISINLPLKDVGKKASEGNGGSGFWLNGYAGVPGNKELDLNQISAFGFSIQIEGPKDGAIVKGEFILDNWRFKKDITKPIPVLNFENPRDIAVEPDGNLITTDANLYALVRANPATGELYMISSKENGTGPRIILHRGIAVAPNGDIFVLDSGPNRLTKVNPRNGHRTAISDSLIGTGPFFEFPRFIEVESSGNLLVTDSDLDAVLRVDAATGNRTIISNSTIGLGPDFKYPRGISIQDDGSILVTDTDLKAVVHVDQENGDRTILSGKNKGEGPLFQDPHGIAIESDGSILITDEVLKAVIRINAKTGDRMIVSDASSGDGINLEIPRALAVMKNGGIAVFDRGLAKIIYVDPLTGNRSISPSVLTSNDEIRAATERMQSHTLEQNFPNPFDSYTFIPVNISSQAHVKLSVYNAYGNNVAILVDETMPRGSYKLKFEAQNLPVGIYYFRLQVGDDVQTRKALLTQ